MLGNNPKVSAIITTKNRCALLKRAVESVLLQTYKNIECIVVDDASTDETEDYCNSLGNVVYVRIPADESRGGNYARNQGVKKAVGEYIAFLDDDDYWLPEKIEKQVCLIQKKHNGLVYCGRRYERITEKGVSFSDELPHVELQGDMSKKILKEICTVTSNILVEKKLLVLCDGFDEKLKFWQEYELLIRLAQKTPFFFVNEALSIYRVDLNDANRLTNKFYSWMESVNYIYCKHAVLYRKLGFIGRLEARTIVWRDAVARCKNAGLQRLALQNMLLYLCISFPFKIKNKLVRIWASV
ncbi:glycosyltransferase family 2 protein [Fibrobacter sp. UWB10]|uniref:glycosyltransferase family 2 protein n=1 Tax=Fibrobacter sp. UWB10 TaxID=1896201 RepID=UPI002403162F|nr:glycosyltransferase family 2 protein [Fibrobacter sp. UWB10]SMP40428.1 Glycosyltransferase involved in cell wall bisynthesis [Fibrobacter sp. UWB10]